MKDNRVLLGLFGALDLLLLFRFIDHIQLVAAVFRAPLTIPAIVALLRAAFLLSLAASAYGFLRGRAWAFVVSYVQLPLRILGLYLSFGFITFLARLIDGRSLYLVLLGVAVFLEIARVIITVRIHHKGAEHRSAGDALQRA